MTQPFGAMALFLETRQTKVPINVSKGEGNDIFKANKGKKSGYMRRHHNVNVGLETGFTIPAACNSDTIGIFASCDSLCCETRSGRVRRDLHVNAEVLGDTRE